MIVVWGDSVVDADGCESGICVIWEDGGEGEELARVGETVSGETEPSEVVGGMESVAVV